MSTGNIAKKISKKKLGEIPMKIRTKIGHFKKTKLDPLFPKNGMHKVSTFQKVLEP